MTNTKFFKEFYISLFPLFVSSTTMCGFITGLGVGLNEKKII